MGVQRTIIPLSRRVWLELELKGEGGLARRCAPYLEATFCFKARGRKIRRHAFSTYYGLDPLVNPGKSAERLLSDYCETLSRNIEEQRALHAAAQSALAELSATNAQSWPAPELEPDEEPEEPAPADDLEGGDTSQ